MAPCPSGRSLRGMRKLRFLPLILVVPVILLILGFFWWRDISEARDPRDSSTHEFLITRGEALQKIALRLEKEGLIKSAPAFRYYVQLKGLQKDIKAGDYRLSPNLSLQQMVLTLLKGPAELWVTYPEGLRREEMAAKTIKTLEISPDLTKGFWDAFMVESKGEEGFLFPDTYLFPRDVKAEKVVAKLRATFDAKVTDQMRQDLKKTGRTLPEAIVLASIVERETNTNEERPIVAGILLKRIEIGMALQADATLQYVSGCKRLYKLGQLPLDCDWWEAPTVEDKKLNSPYNTYLNSGLPPFPIASPGIESIKAVIYPESSDYLFYLHGKDGKIRYGETIDDHNENIQKYL